MKLEDIGFYTLSDDRALNSSAKSPLWRCELILTDTCNFNCTYCRGLRKDIAGTMPLDQAEEVVKLWCDEGLKNVRFSGGEPTMYDGLERLVSYCNHNGVERIALSTNGSADWDVYRNLIRLGVNDFSISLDACCAATQDQMSGKKNTFHKIVDNIKRVAKKVYTTVGCVVNEDNLESVIETAEYADSLGVSDIRIIPSAQYNKLLEVLNKMPRRLLDKYPILRYRVENGAMFGRNVRGLTDNDSGRCQLAMDDMAVAGGYHFPCIIYMREQGDPIGKVGPDMRQERNKWVQRHDCQKDPICKKNCLDVCIDYNNTWRSMRNEVIYND